MTCNAGEVVVVPFPFTDGPQTKPRPALILSSLPFNHQTGHTLMAMITSQHSICWDAFDVPFDWSAVGLHSECKIRMKLFTIDNRLIRNSIGLLNAADWTAVQKRFQRMFA